MYQIRRCNANYSDKGTTIVTCVDLESAAETLEKLKNLHYNGRYKVFRLTEVEITVTKKYEARTV
jgi:hypothetical protein